MATLNKTQWHWRTFEQLTVQELYDILALRQRVFVLEQKCLYPDIDYNDQKALHLLGTSHNKLVGYLRFFPKGTLHTEAHSFGRFLTDPNARGKGLAKEAMKKVEQYLQKSSCQAPTVISAQLYLKAFYEDFGFLTIDEPYEEDGIPHIKMKKS